jgi:hypothetical protein
MPTMLVATSRGLLTYDEGGKPGSVGHDGRAVTAVCRDRDDVWSILDAAEIWHRAATGWRHAASLDGLRATCVAVTDGVLVGTSEARLFRLTGDRLDPIESFDAVDGRPEWHTPWGGPPDTRSIAEWDEAVYVNVHVGGIVRTLDGGATWAPTIDIHADVHQVTTAEGLVLAACAEGLAVSTDRGGSWRTRTDGLAATYARAVAVCGDAVLVSASRGPRGGEAAVYRGDLRGEDLVRCEAGLPEWFDDNIDSHCLDALPDGSFAAFGTEDGRLFASADTGRTWDEVADDLPPVTSLLVLP